MHRAWLLGCKNQKPHFATPRRPAPPSLAPPLSLSPVGRKRERPRLSLRGIGWAGPSPARVTGGPSQGMLLAAARSAAGPVAARPRTTTCPVVGRPLASDGSFASGHAKQKVALISIGRACPRRSYGLVGLAQLLPFLHASLLPGDLGQQIVCHLQRCEPRGWRSAPRRHLRKGQSVSQKRRSVASVRMLHDSETVSTGLRILLADSSTDWGWCEEALNRITHTRKVSMVWSRAEVARRCCGGSFHLRGGTMSRGFLGNRACISSQPRRGLGSLPQPEVFMLACSHRSGGGALLPPWFWQP